jgi:hypothetical protein
MPASQTNILAFIGYLASLGRIRSSSLQPYLSDINSLHADFGFPKSAQGHWISLARKGFGEIDGSFNQAPTNAAPFPASYMLSILMHGLQDTTSSRHVRLCKNIVRSQAAPLSRVTSATHDPQRLFQQLQKKWKRLRGHNINKAQLALSRRKTGDCTSDHDLAS